jgi:predicted DNA-binding transcriptional regulator AlpA
MQPLSSVLRRGDVERVTGLSRSTIYDYMARGQFPRPIRLSGKSVGGLAACRTEAGELGHGGMGM